MIDLERLRYGRFVILQHDFPFLHWDFLLEQQPAAVTWRLLACPALNLAIPAQRIADHRLWYLDYEGPVDGNRGIVTRVQNGHFRVLLQSPSMLEIQLLETDFASTARLQIMSHEFQVAEPQTVEKGGIVASADPAPAEASADCVWTFKS